MLILKRFLTFGPCLVLFSILILFCWAVGSVQTGIGGAGVGIGLMLLTTLGLAATISSLLTFGGVIPWCRKEGHQPGSIFKLVVWGIPICLLAASLYLYLSITILDEPAQAHQLTAIGMSQAQVVAAIGEPDWKEPGRLWAYRVRGDGIGGLTFPYYYTFDVKGILVSVHS